MKKRIYIIIPVLVMAVLSSGGCKKKEKQMVDMNTIQTDGSHDQRYIFREEIEKEKQREEKSRKSDF